MSKPSCANLHFLRITSVPLKKGGSHWLNLFPLLQCQAVMPLAVMQADAVYSLAKDWIWLLELVVCDCPLYSFGLVSPQEWVRHAGTYGVFVNGGIAWPFLHQQCFIRSTAQHTECQNNVESSWYWSRNICLIHFSPAILEAMAKVLVWRILALSIGMVGAEGAMPPPSPLIF